MREETPIFTRTFDLLTWLLPQTNHFPRAHRHTVTQRLLDAAFDLREQLEAANLRRGRQRAEHLLRADEALGRLRVYVRLASRWDWLNSAYRNRNQPDNRNNNIGFRVIVSTLFNVDAGNAARRVPTLLGRRGEEKWRRRLLAA